VGHHVHDVRVLPGGRLAADITGERLHAGVLTAPVAPQVALARDHHTTVGTHDGDIVFAGFSLGSPPFCRPTIELT